MGLRPLPTGAELWTTVFKTGMRVPTDGEYRDQDGVTSIHVMHGTFPPTFKTAHRSGGDCAYYQLVRLLP